MKSVVGVGIGVLSFDLFVSYKSLRFMIRLLGWLRIIACSELLEMVINVSGWDVAESTCWQPHLPTSKEGYFSVLAVL